MLTQLNGSSLKEFNLLICQITFYRLLISFLNWPVQDDLSIGISALTDAQLNRNAFNLATFLAIFNNQNVKTFKASQIFIIFTFHSYSDFNSDFQIHNFKNAKLFNVSLRGSGIKSLLKLLNSKLLPGQIFIDKLMGSHAKLDELVDWTVRKTKL